MTDFDEGFRLLLKNGMSPQEDKEKKALCQLYTAYRLLLEDTPYLWFDVVPMISNDGIKSFGKLFEGTGLHFKAFVIRDTSGRIWARIVCIHRGEGDCEAIQNHLQMRCRVGLELPPFGCAFKGVVVMNRSSE